MAMRNALAALAAFAVLTSLVATSSIVGAAERFPWEGLEDPGSQAIGASFPVTPTDLEFIKGQIELAENHSARILANPSVEPCSLLIGDPATDGPVIDESEGNAHEFPLGIRTISGMCNNLLPGNENFGAADVAFERLTTPVVDPLYAPSTST